MCPPPRGRASDARNLCLKRALFNKGLRAWGFEPHNARQLEYYVLHQVSKVRAQAWENPRPQWQIHVNYGLGLRVLLADLILGYAGLPLPRQWHGEETTVTQDQERRAVNWHLQMLRISEDNLRGKNQWLNLLTGQPQTLDSKPESLEP